MSEQEIDGPRRRAERLRRQIERHNRFYSIRGDVKRSGWLQPGKALCSFVSRRSRRTLCLLQTKQTAYFICGFRSGEPPVASNSFSRTGSPDTLDPQIYRSGLPTVHIP